MRALLLITSSLILAACGADDGGRRHAIAARTADATGVSAPDGKRANAALPEGETPAAKDPALADPRVDACNETGFVFERRHATCSAEVRLATSYACDRDGIAAAFAPTGYQIDAALDDALGSGSDPGEGYLIDQCGETDAGRLVVYLAKPSVRRGQPVLLVREIETTPKAP
jgi:hypothetical protein